MADDAKKPKASPDPRGFPEKTVDSAGDEDDEMLLAGALGVLRMLFRPRPSRRRGPRP